MDQQTKKETDPTEILLTIVNKLDDVCCRLEEIDRKFTEHMSHKVDSPAQKVEKWTNHLRKR